jgi:uncharacterized protein (DUF302 family)
MIVKRSAAAYADTVSRLLEAIEERNLTVFARIDHAAGARAAGLELASEEVVAFGNPRAGTPLMQSDPRVGIELPLRILAWEDEQGALLGYRDPRELARDYDVGENRDALEAMASLLDALVTAATSSSNT